MRVIRVAQKARGRIWLLRKKRGFLGHPFAFLDHVYRLGADSRFRLRPRGRGTGTHLNFNELT